VTVAEQQTQNPGFRSHWTWVAPGESIAVRPGLVHPSSDLGQEFLRQIAEHVETLRGLPVRNWQRSCVSICNGDNATLGRTTYLSVLLLHEGLHPDLELALDAAVRRVAAAFKFKRDPAAEAIAAGGTQALRATPELFVGASAIRPLGVSGAITTIWGGDHYLLVAQRSDDVAVNPGTISFAAEGGVDAPPDDVTEVVVSPELLVGEWRDELHGLTEVLNAAQWELSGLMLPSPAKVDLLHRRSGANAR